MPSQAPISRATPAAGVAPSRPSPAPPWRGQGRVVCAVAVGGGMGAAARYGASLLWPTASDAFPWTTFAVNVVGCALMGVLMVLVTEVRPAHPLVRPFLGTGFLGGFTTFSTYAVDFERLVDSGRAGVGLSYLAVTVLAAPAAVWCAVVVTRRATRTGGGGR